MNEVPQQTGSKKHETPCIILLGLLIVVGLACDYLFMPLLAAVPQRPDLNYPLLMTCAGCVLAQFYLLAAWLAWSDQPFGQRLLRYSITVAILYLVWAAGLALALPIRFALASSMVGLSVPLVSIAAQLPLSVTRQTLGWRLIRGDMNHQDEKPLTIRDLMLATVLFALALTSACWVPSPDGKEMRTPLIIVFLAATTFSTLSLIPASVLLLRTQRLPLGLLGACLYAAFWIALPWMVALVAQNRGFFASPPATFLIAVSCLILSFAATVVLAATAARALGYRLRSGQRPRKSSV